MDALTSPLDPADGAGGLPVVEVGPFRVLDATRAEFVERAVTSGAAATDGPVHVYALHVGGLNARHDAPYVEAMRQAEMVGADGGSVIWVAKLAGAQRMERVPTTDIGWEILHLLADRLRRPVRVALVGGPDGLAERAGQVLVEGAPVRLVHTEHGFHDDWTEPLKALRAASPDVTFVGLGAPNEMIWCQRHRPELTGRLVVTCGGWFGHLSGDEVRAPSALRRSGIEWVARVAQSPRRLGPRYARGVYSSAVLSVTVLGRRWGSRRR